MRKIVLFLLLAVAALMNVYACGKVFSVYFLQISWHIHLCVLCKYLSMALIFTTFKTYMLPLKNHNLRSTFKILVLEPVPLSASNSNKTFEAHFTLSCLLKNHDKP